MSFTRLSIWLFLSLGFVAVESPAQEQAPDVVRICTVCHGEDGSGVGFEDVPIVAGTPAAHIEEALYAYLDGARICVSEPMMCDSLDTLTEEEIAEAADYYAAMPRIWSEEPYNKHLATAGEKLHKQYCARCHVLPEDEDVEDALGIPLHGQRAAYLRLAFDSYANGNRLTLVPQMAEAMAKIDEDDFEALINYYASYKSPRL